MQERRGQSHDSWDGAWNGDVACKGFNAAKEKVEMPRVTSRDPFDFLSKEETLSSRVSHEERDDTRVFAERADAQSRR